MEDLPSPSRENAPISPPESETEGEKLVLEEDNQKSRSPERKHNRNRNIWQMENTDEPTDSGDFQNLLEGYQTKRRHRSDSVSTTSSSSRRPKREAAEPWKPPGEVGEAPFGKELSIFDVSKCNGQRGKVKVVQKFENQSLDKAMGVELLQDQVIICNTFKNEVDFFDWKKNGGALVRTIPTKDPRFTSRDYQPFQPAQCTVLQSGQTVLLDKNGITIFSATANEKSKICPYKTARLSEQYRTRGNSAQSYGLLTSRRGLVGTYLRDDELGDVIVWVENIDKPIMEWSLRESKINFGCQTTIRFCASFGNTIAMSDMSDSPKLWLLDLDGNVRHRVKLRDLDCRQPAGVCFDAGGNVLLSDSKAKKIMVFDKEGEFQYDLDICDKFGMRGYLMNESNLRSRLTDIALNDNGEMVIMCPLPGRNNDRGRRDFGRDRGRDEKKDKCFLLCKFATTDQVESNGQVVIKEDKVTKRKSGIFEEVEIDDTIDASDAKNDFDQAWDQAEADSGSSFGGGGGRDNNQPVFERANFNQDPNRHAKPMSMRQEKPQWLQDQERDNRGPPNRGRGGGRGGFGRGGGGRGGSFAGRKRDREDSSDRWSQNEEPPRQKSSWGQSSQDQRDRWSNAANSSNSSWGASKSPTRASSSGWGSKSPDEAPKSAWGSNSNDEPVKKSGGWGSNSPDNKPSSSGGWGSKSEETKKSTGWGSASPDEPAKKSGGGGWGSASPDETSKGGWGSTSNETKKSGGWGSNSPDGEKSAWGGSSSSTSGWGNSESKPASSGWGSKSPDEAPKTGGWGSTDEPKKSGGGGWGSSSPEEPAKTTSGGWGSTSDTKGNSSGGWGATSAEPAKETTGGWGSTEKTTGWGSTKEASPEKKADDGWGSKETSSSGGWGSSAPDKNNDGWGAKETDKKEESSDGWGNSGPKEDTVESSPPKIVNQPPVECVVDEKSDPRKDKNKKRISLSAYKERKKTLSNSEQEAEATQVEQKEPEKSDEKEEKKVKVESAEKTTEEMPTLSLDFSSSEGEQEKTGEESPTSPSFEPVVPEKKPETVPELIPNVVKDPNMSKTILADLESELLGDDTQQPLVMDTQIEDDDNAKFSTDEEEFEDAQTDLP